MGGLNSSQSAWQLSAQVLWQDGELFSSSVTGLALQQDVIGVAVDRKRDIWLGVGDMSLS